MKIVFWGDTQAAGTTSNMLATASALAIQYPYQSVMLQTAGKGNAVDISKSFSETEPLEEELKEGCAYYPLRGLDYLYTVGKKGVLTAKQIQDNMQAVIEKKLYCLSSGSRMLCNFYPEETNQILANVIRLADQQMDFTFIDCGCRTDAWTQELIKNADLLVVNLAQTQKSFDHFFLNHIKLSENIIFFISSYQKDSTYNKKNIHRLYRIEPERLAVVPYNPEFAHACEKGRLDKYMKGRGNLYSTQMRRFFMQEVMQAVQILLEYADDTGKK